MKQELTKYTCDNCKNTITVGRNVYAGTPLDNSWVRLFLKVKPSDMLKTKLHFCTECCAEVYLHARVK